MEEAGGGAGEEEKDEDQYLLEDASVRCCRKMTTLPD